MDSRSFFASFKPHPLPTSTTERFRSALAGGTAILLLILALQYLPQTFFPMLIIASMAASATLLYAIPHSPLSQPWNLVGGHVISAIAGLLCGTFIPDQTIAAGSAVGLAILLMQFLSCLHPPSAATALMMVLGTSPFHAMHWPSALAIVTINAGIMLLLALLINNMLPGRHYPAQVPPAATPPKPAPFIALEKEDIRLALEQMESAIDVSEEDLAKIYKLALQSAQQRIDAALPR